MKILGTENIITIVKIPAFTDERGTFYQLRVPPSNLDHLSGQIVQSKSHKNVFRGLHWQTGMNKAIRVVKGAADIVNVDLHNFYSIDNKSHHEWCVVSLDENDSVWVMGEWFIARGVYIKEQDTIIEYMCSDIQRPDLAYTINIKSPELNMSDSWSPESMIMNERDLNAPTLNELFYGGSI